MAYLMPLDKPRCITCQLPATQRLYHWRNHSLGTYCTRHADAALKKQEATEERERPS